jgi:biopolymer transport protein ExbD
MTPLIDVVFLLIIFFMLTSSFVHVSGIRVRLPNAESAKKVDLNTGFTVEIDARGRFFVNEEEISLQALMGLFEQHKKETTVTISADKQVEFEAVMQVWDAARKHGFKEVMVLTTQ